MNVTERILIELAEDMEKIAGQQGTDAFGRGMMQGMLLAAESARLRAGMVPALIAKWDDPAPCYVAIDPDDRR